MDVKYHHVGCYYVIDVLFDVVVFNGNSSAWPRKERFDRQIENKRLCCKMRENEGKGRGEGGEREREAEK